MAEEKGLTLWQINDQIADCLNNLIATANEETGEVSFEGLERLEALKLSKAEKRENTALWLQDQEAFESRMKDAIAELQQRLKVHQKRKEYVERGLLIDLLESGDSGFESVKVKYGTRKSSGVVIDDKDKLPPEFVTIKQTFCEDKKAISAAIKAGRDVPGAHIEERVNLAISKAKKKGDTE